MGIGDWGLGQIPNPQSPIIRIFYFIYEKNELYFYLIKYKFNFNKLITNK